MATSKRESQPNGSRAVRNMSPVLKPRESDRGLLQPARSVPSSPHRRSSASTAASRSTNACTASSRSSTSGSSSSSRPSMVGAKQAAGAVRRRADKSGGATSVWPHALTTPGKDPENRAARSTSTTTNAQKSKLSARQSASSPKPRTRSQKARNPGATAKRRTGLETSSVHQRATSVPVTAAVAPKADEQDVELLVEAFDEMDCISTPSIEEHLQERLPDPSSPSETSSNREERHKDVQEVSITEHVISEEQHEGSADAGLYDTGVVVVAMETVGETELNDSVGENALKGAVDEPKSNEADGETELKDPESAVKEEEAKTLEAVHQRSRKDDGKKSDGVAEEGRSKTSTMQERRNKVMALVGRFETAMSGRE
jgi:hypothetical protein